MTGHETMLRQDTPEDFYLTAMPIMTSLTQSVPVAGSSQPDIGVAIGSDSMRGTVVLVEIQDEICRLITRLLEIDGYMVLKTSSLAEARILLRETTANLMLTRRRNISKTVEADLILHELESKTTIRIVDNYTELMLGRGHTNESMSQDHMATLDLLISLIESNNDHARGHAHNVAKYCRLVGQRMGLNRHQLDTLTLAAYLHDLGTLVTSRQIGPVIGDDGRPYLPSYEQTADMLASVPFAVEAGRLLAVASDRNLETGSSVEVSPAMLSAHILRLADFYDSVRRQCAEVGDQDELFAWMRGVPGEIFDAGVLDVFINIRKKELAINSLNLFTNTVVVVDPEPDALRPLLLRLERADYRLITARTPTEAIPILRSQPVALVLTEYKFAFENGFILLQQMKSDPRLKHIPVVFHADADDQRIKQALELGAEDWISKPHNFEILAIKLFRIMERQSGQSCHNDDGVQGNIRDLGVIELVQVLSSSNRSAVISIDHGAHKGELYVQGGQVIHAVLSELTGDLAAVEIMLWEDGHFLITPLKSAPMPTVTMSTDSLVLEACLQKDLRSHARAAEQLKV